MGTEIPLSYYLIVSAMLFSIGTIAVLVRRNALVIFMGVEMMLNSVNLTFIAFAKYRSDLDGHSIALFVMAVAAAEAAVGLAIVLNLFRHKRSVNVDDATSLRH
ncbi:MAG: NADH-quinone oxidoreductase subunit K [Deltaproteobacteria bacterium CG2_30_63_29]|nr:MAG: NADH-quinone oxidoreductase subunit K [Deltaproteobacteria bacterium CG2_30_63_29]PIV99552.1 MAG: NADH-quinone oxidoreductase subunit NuoK [Deltaproteobacteria bacterium CG17_big_fil_post_rev_8_21_14_2_50_63_7]PJB41099.1 MAG: NADH-quinone oxidoreductase subunit NuoK [Deltaproteobacteria bacterium CG_4_9_14_3_um_filter_63_12]